MLIEVPDDQIEWLRRDLAIQNEDKRVLVFFHEPTLEWKKSDAIEVLDLLKQHEAEEIFCGHFHFNKLFYARGIPEQVTGAVCGNWWYDNLCLDGCPSGYRVVIVDTYISTFYKGMGGEKWE
jgi:UDP-2,3-diacylglucosamine pyrophosphatase LpxH